MKVSIVTPTYNSGKFIERTAKSVLNQTFQDWEWILVDDLSKDDTKEILKKLEKEDSRIKCYFSETNKGQSNLFRNFW
jgi:teichuronic acid biosynthesis glycosyltransferase TuaG